MLAVNYFFICVIWNAVYCDDSSYDIYFLCDYLTYDLFVHFLFNKYIIKFKFLKVF